MGLSYALLALYRQQVNCRFVLADPLEIEDKRDKEFFDPVTGITFHLQWNPHRELRKNRQLLIKHGVIAENVDPTRLINKDTSGKACFLCSTNISLQNPHEILLEANLAGEDFYIGANFAYITNNHFTLINAVHRPQQYRKKILTIGSDFTEKTDGRFRVIFNSLAGATILSHEHLQATTEPFPIEQIRITDDDIVCKNRDVTVSRPTYYVPLWLIQGRDTQNIHIAADTIIRAWHELNPNTHTENVITVKSGGLHRVFIILRDKNKLAAPKFGKTGALAAFETAGNIVLSHQPTPGQADELNEKDTFGLATLETLRHMVAAVSPSRQSIDALFERISSANIWL